MAKPNEQNKTKGKSRTPGEPPKPGQPGHDEWLLDESVEESFPASDPVTPARSGSTLAKRYETTKKAAGAAKRKSPPRGGGRGTG
jgi:hypothetical protein